MAACHFLLDLLPPVPGGDFSVSSSPGFSLLLSSCLGKAEQVDKEDAQTQRAGSGQGQGSRSANLYAVRSLGYCQVGDSLDSIAVFEL